MKVVFNITNKVFYTFIAIALVTCLAIVGYAYKSGGPPSKLGHSAEELEVQINGNTYTLQNAITNNLIGSANCEVVYEGETGGTTGKKVTVPNRCLDTECSLFIKVTDAGDQKFSTFISSAWKAGRYFQLDTQAGTPASWIFKDQFTSAETTGKNGETAEVILKTGLALQGESFPVKADTISLYDDHYNEEIGIKEWFIHEDMAWGKTGKATVKLTAC